MADVVTSLSVNPLSDIPDLTLQTRTARDTEPVENSQCSRATQLLLLTPLQDEGIGHLENVTVST
jgi:hypothetical protein